MAKLEVYEDTGGGFRWRKRVSSDITADSGEAYASKEGAMRAAESEANEGDVVVFLDKEATGQ